MRERIIERFLREKVKQAGGWAIKFTPSGTAGVPDRIVIWPGGRIDFVECKTFGGKVGPLQQYRHEQLRAMGCNVVVITCQEEVRSYVGLPSPRVPEVCRELVDGETSGGAVSPARPRQD